MFGIINPCSVVVKCFFANLLYFPMRLSNLCRQLAKMLKISKILQVYEIFLHFLLTSGANGFILANRQCAERHAIENGTMMFIK